MPSLGYTENQSASDIDLLVKHLPLGCGDQRLLVLKAHLLLEDLLTEFIASKVSDPSQIEAGQFRFPQRIALARMLSPKGSNDWVWEALKQLNSLRNTLAHRLESGEAENKLNRFLGAVRQSEQTQAFGPLADGVIRLYFGLADHLRFKTYQELLADALRNWRPPA